MAQSRPTARRKGKTPHAMCGALPDHPKGNPGADLLSHVLADAVPSALAGLTTVFGMGTGVAPPV